MLEIWHFPIAPFYMSGETWPGSFSLPECGGREIGKRLADAFDIPYYDHEVIDTIDERHGFEKGHGADVSEKDLRVDYLSTIGRCADVVCRDMNPFRIFVYADRLSKLKRCEERADENEHFTEKEMLRKMKQIDRERALYRELFTEDEWGKRESYDLCVNASGKEIRTLIPALLGGGHFHVVPVGFRRCDICYHICRMFPDGERNTGYAIACAI